MVLRAEKTKDYTTMCNHHLKNKEMSLKAKGLLSMILSLPDDWTYTVNGLVSICKESETAIKSALKELKELGYLVVTRERRADGKFEYIYTVYEKPQDVKPEVEKPQVENPPMDNPPMENHPLYKNTNILNTNILNIKDKKVYFPNDDKLNETFKDFVEFRRKIKKPMADKAVQLAINELNELTQDRNEMIDIINQSILKGWQSFYPLMSVYDNKPKKQFHNFSQRDYNYDELEKKMLSR